MPRAAAQSNTFFKTGMKTEAAKEAFDGLMDAGINFVACLPDSAFKELYEPLSGESRIDYIQVANEGDGVGERLPRLVG